jgi:hypothetical protein
MKATISNGAVIIEGSVAEIAGFFQGRPQETKTVSDDSVTHTPFTMTRSIVTSAPKRAYNKMRTKKSWRASEDRELLSKWLPLKAGHKARTRRRTNKGVAAELKRTHHACAWRYAFLKSR